MDLHELIEITKQVKQDFCLRAEGPSDVLPIIRVEVAADQRPIMIPVTGDSEPMGNLKIALSMLLDHFKTTNQVLQFERIAFVSEGYVRTMAEYPNSYKPGNLEEEYKNDPTSDIVQCLMINLFNWDCSSETAIIQYGYDDYGKPVFGQEDIQKGSVGRVVEIMKSFRAYCKFLQEKVA